MYLPKAIILIGLFSALLAMCSACDARTRRQQNLVRTKFTSLSNQIKDYDEKVYLTCKQFTKYAARQLFGDNGYKLEVIAPGMAEAIWEVTIKHRMVWIVGRLTVDASKGCDLIYADMRTLPEFTQIRNSAWMYDNNKFVFAVPFAYDVTSEHRLDCYKGTDGSTFTVRRGFPDEALFQ